MHLGLQVRWHWIAAAVGLVCICTAAHAQAQADTALRVLIINSYNESTAPYLQSKNVFMTELQKHSASPIAFRQFNLEMQGGKDEGYELVKMRLLELEYAIKPPDLVIAMGPPATAFWLNFRGPFFSKAPFIAAGAQITLEAMSFQPGDAAVVTRFSFREAVEDFLRIQPDTTQILIVLGASAHEEGLVSLARRQLEGLSSRISFEYTNRMKLSALQDRLAHLLPGSAVLFGIFDSDAEGVQLLGYTGLTLVRANSSVPVFGAFDDQLGQGIVGGRMIQLTLMGIEMARTAQEILVERPSVFNWKVVELSAPTYDWRELQAWGISPERLPPGSIIRFRPESLWERYPGWITLIVLIIGAQVLLIVSLVLQHKHRQSAEVLSRQLSRRLISAQEDERRLLARELHDDLSQRLARLAIDAGYVASNPSIEAAKGVMQNLQPELVSISKDIHDISYRLHPSLIRDLGLLPALQAECARMRRYTDADIIERFDEIAVKVPADQALCVYRITQEAINNAVRYASAKTIEITLVCDKQSLGLTVHDDGVGFELARDATFSGLGLLSMNERAQAAGGTCVVRSQPGLGTTVCATIPLNGTAL